MATSDKLDENMAKMISKDEEKVQEVIGAIKEYLNTTLQSTNRELILNTFNEMVESSEFDKNDFKSLHGFLKYNKTKNIMLENFVLFFENLLIIKEQKIPIEVIEYENYLEGIEYIKNSFSAVEEPFDNLLREYEPGNRKVFDHDAYYALCLYEERAGEAYSYHKEIYEKCTNKLMENKNTFRGVLFRLVKYYRLSSNSEVEKAKLINSIPNYLGIRDTKS